MDVIRLNLSTEGHHIFSVVHKETGRRYIAYFYGDPNDEDMYNSLTDKDLAILNPMWKLGRDKFRFEIEVTMKDDIYKDEIIKTIQRRYANIGLYHKEYSSNEGIINTTTGMTFTTTTEAGEYYDIDSSSIRKVLRGKRKTAGGYGWKYYAEWLEG